MKRIGRIPKMKIMFEVHVPRILGHQLPPEITAESLSRLLDAPEAEIDLFRDQLKKSIDKGEIPFNELAECIKAIQTAPVKRDDDGTPITYGQQGQYKTIPFTRKQHKMNGELLKILFGVIDKIEEDGKVLETQREPVLCMMKPDQVVYLSRNIMRRCIEYNFTGEHITYVLEKWEEYAKVAKEEMKDTARKKGGDAKPGAKASPKTDNKE